MAGRTGVFVDLAAALVVVLAMSGWTVVTG